MPINVSKMSDEELLNALEEPADKGIVDQVIEADKAAGDVLSDFGESVGTGVREGLISTGEKTTMFIKELLDRTGITSEEGTKTFKAGVGEARRKRKELIESQRFPGVADVSQSAGEILPFLATPGGTIGKAVLSGAAIGAIESEDDRLGGAALGAGAAGVLGGLVRGGRKLLPQRSGAVTEASRTLGTKATRAQLIGKDSRGTKLLEVDEAAKKLVPEESITTLSDDFEKLLKNREDAAGRVANRLIDKAVKGKAGAQKFEFSEVRDAYKAIRGSLSQNSETAVKNFITTMDDVMSKPLSIRQAKDLTVGNGKITKQVSKIFRDAPDVAKEAQGVRDLLRKGMEDRLKDLDPNAFNKFKAGLEISRRKITEIANKDITKSIRSGDFDSIISQLKKADGAKTLKQIQKAMGPKGKDILEAGVVKRAYQKAFDKNNVFDARKFNKTLGDISSSSGLKLSKDLNTFVHNANVMFETIKKNPPTRFAGVSEVGGTQGFKFMTAFRIGLEKLLNSKTGIKLTTRAKFKSPQDVRARKLVDDIVKVGISIGLDKESNQFDVQGLSDDDLLREAERLGL